MFSHLKLHPGLDCVQSLKSEAMRRLKCNNMMSSNKMGCNKQKTNNNGFIAQTMFSSSRLSISGFNTKHCGEIPHALIRAVRCLVFWADVLTALEHSPHCAWMCVCVCLCVSECVQAVCVCKLPPLVLMTTDCHRVWRWTNGIKKKNTPGKP